METDGKWWVSAWHDYDEIALDFDEPHQLFDTEEQPEILPSNWPRTRTA